MLLFSKLIKNGWEGVRTQLSLPVSIPVTWNRSAIDRPTVGRFVATDIELDSRCTLDRIECHINIGSKLPKDLVGRPVGKPVGGGAPMSETDILQTS